MSWLILLLREEPRTPADATSSAEPRGRGGGSGCTECTLDANRRYLARSAESVSSNPSPPNSLISDALKT